IRPAAPAGPLATASLLTPSATSAEIASPRTMLLYTPSMKARRPWSTSACVRATVPPQAEGFGLNCCMGVLLRNSLRGIRVERGSLVPRAPTSAAYMIIYSDPEYYATGVVLKAPPPRRRPRVNQ